MVPLFQRFLWADHLMKLSQLEKKFLKNLRFLNLNQVEKIQKKVLLFVKNLDSLFKIKGNRI